jgi:hypothetical protein
VLHGIPRGSASTSEKRSDELSSHFGFWEPARSYAHPLGPPKGLKLNLARNVGQDVDNFAGQAELEPTDWRPGGSDSLNARHARTSEGATHCQDRRDHLTRGLLMFRLW